MPSRVNRLMVKEAVEHYRSAGSMVAIAYRGISAEDATALRRKLRDDHVELRVVKNRLTKLAMGELGRDDFGSLLDGQTAVIVCDDPVRASKVAVEFTRERKLDVRGGWAEGRALSTEDIRRLATIPPKNVLLGRIAWLAAAPLTGLVGVLQAPCASLARALRAWGEKREGPQESEES